MKKICTIFLMLFVSIVLFAQNPPYTKTTIVTGLTYPVAFDFLPNGDYLITQKGGNTNPATTAQIKYYNSAGTFVGVFYNLSDSVDCDFERGLLGICIDANYSTNHYVYVYYVHLYGGDERLRVVRFTENNFVGTNPFIVFDHDVPNNIPGNHVGGNVRMHASEPDKIYITIGDLASSQSDTVVNYAHMLTNPYGKVLRVNTNRTIPTTNPFYDDGNPLVGNCDYIWSYGHRNHFDLAFSPVNDSLYVSENGWNTWDEANQITKGKNYGWNICEGFFRNTSTSIPCNHVGFTDPITAWGNPPAVTGIMIYSGSTFPTLNNHMLVADNDFGRVYNVTLTGPAYNTASSNVQWADFTTSGGLTTIKQGTDGCVYMMKGGYTTNGEIYRVCPVGLYVGESTDQDYFLSAPFPNPTNDVTTLNYTLKKIGTIKIVLTDVSGREITELLNEKKAAGTYSLNVNTNELKLASGTYMCTLKVTNENSEEFSQTVKFNVIK